MKVERHTDRIGLLLFLHTFQNVQKSENRMGEQTFAGGQGFDAKKGSIDDGITVKNH